MSTLGKILIAANMVFSIIFMTLAMSVYSNHTQWNVKAAAQKIQLRDKQSQNDNLTSQLNTLKEDRENERNQLNGQIASLETEKETLRRERKQLLDDEAQLRESERRAVAEMKSAHDTLADLRTQVDGLRADIRAAELSKDTNFDEMVKKTDELYQANGELSRLESTNRELIARLAKTGMILEHHGLDENVPLDGIPPKVRGLVVDTRENGFVEVSIGSDDGLRPGHFLEVYRNDKYVGRLEVLKTATDKSVGKVIREFQRAPIRIEDHVATRLN